MKRLFCTTVLTLLLICTLRVPSQALDHDMLKVGLRFGSDALFSANLWNYNDEPAGSGYEIGYYDTDRSFVALVETDEEKISVTADGNIYVASGLYYETMPSAGASVIGGYHLQLAEPFETAEEAQEAAGQYANAFLAFLSDGVYVRIGSFADMTAAVAAVEAWDGEEAVELVQPSSTGVTVTKYASTTILCEFDYGGLRSLGVLPRSIDGERTRVWFKNRVYFGGFEYQRVTGGSINVINVVNIEDYVKCVITGEMSADWPLEALKAQSVCARTYAAQQQRHKTSGFDVCTTDDCQVYYGSSACTADSDRAVDETAGKYLYYNGELVSNAVYYSYNGGASEDCKNVWYSDVPYLKGKIDPYEEDIAAVMSGYYWSVSFTADELTTILNAKLSDENQIGRVTNVYVSEFTDMGNVLAVTFEGTRGSYTARKEACRTIFNGVISGKSVRSMRFTIGEGDAQKVYVNPTQDTMRSISGAYVISGDGKVSQHTGSSSTTYVLTADGLSPLREEESAAKSGLFTITGSGHGHNIGMSQWGAYAMAERGYDYTDILTFYYTGVTVE